MAVAVVVAVAAAAAAAAAVVVLVVVVVVGWCGGGGGGGGGGDGWAVALVAVLVWVVMGRWGGSERDEAHPHAQSAMTHAKHGTTHQHPASPPAHLGGCSLNAEVARDLVAQRRVGVAGQQDEVAQYRRALVVVEVLGGDAPVCVLAPDAPKHACVWHLRLGAHHAVLPAREGQRHPGHHRRKRLEGTET